ncbi:SRPBCC family protein [Amycolatopsis aidingensis]|uniref:SRPBCC family protein n=1 Tax=Amycolatopsis aidingensis TaxID=2842453 RepID=UPI001E35664A|nr:SRPBCC family protein [Amycolatopsis aidingensis]
MGPNWATMDTVDGKSVLRFERRIAHPPEKVFTALSDPAELAHWFPARVETEPRPGAPMRFVFPGEGTEEGEALTGQVLEFDPPKLFAFEWNGDVLRFELTPDGTGCLLVFTHTVSPDNGGWLAAARNAAGWDTCLAALVAALDGTGQPAAGDAASMLASIESYVERFGLGEGEVHETADGYLLRFERDLVWRPAEQVWSQLTAAAEEGAPEPAPGADPPLQATHGYQEEGRLTEVAAPHLLEYEWLHEGAPAGRVRFEIHTDPQLGTRLVLTQTVPAHLAGSLATVLAAWQTHLELFFAALFGEIRCPWPAERTRELETRYAARR